MPESVNRQTENFPLVWFIFNRAKGYFCKLHDMADWLYLLDKNLKAMRLNVRRNE